MRVAALGRTQWLYDSIARVAGSGHKVVLIGTSPEAPEYTVKEDDFARLARDLDCAFFTDPVLNRAEYLSLLRDTKADVAISVNWLTRIGKQIIDQFKYGIVNAHAGDLPRYRGNAAPNWAILAGEGKVVVTLHQMAEELDAGPILLQRELVLTNATQIGGVYRFITANVPEMFVEVLDELERRTLVPRPQPTDPAVSLRCFPRMPRDGEIDWRQSAEHLAKLVRASSEPFGGAYTFLGSVKLVVWQAEADCLPYPHLGVPGQVIERRPDTGEVVALTGDGVLVLKEVETASGGRARPCDVVKSTRARLGLDVAERMADLERRIRELETRFGDRSTR